MTEFGTVKQVEEKHVSKGVATSPNLRGRAPASQKNLRPYVRQNGLTQSDQIGYMITHVGQKRDSRGHPRPIRRGRGPSVSKIFGTSYTSAHSMKNGNQISYGDQTVRKIFTGPTTNADGRSVCSCFHKALYVTEKKITKDGVGEPHTN